MFNLTLPRLSVVELKGELLIVLAALIWGIAFYFQKTAMTHIGPVLFIGLRGAIAAVVLLPFAIMEQRRSVQLPGSIVAIGCLGGLIFFFAGVLQQKGLVTATVTNTGFLTAIYVVVTPFLFWVFKKKLPSRITGLSAVMAFVGIWALGGGTVGQMTTGDSLVACSSVFWALLIITTGESGKFSQPLSYTCVQFSVVAVLGITLALIVEPVNSAAIAAAAGSILYVGVLSSALTFGLMAIALKTVPAPRASILLSLETLFAAAAGYTFLGERLTVLGILGAILILSAVLILQLRQAPRGS